MTRIEHLTDKSQLPPEQHGEYDTIFETLHRVGGPFGILLHSPGLAERVCLAGKQVRLGSQISMIERELALLSTSREKDASYEWATHVEIARREGMSEDAITAIRENLPTDDLPIEEREIIDYARTLLRTNRVPQDMFDALIERHGPRWLVEITATIGQYQYIAAINNAFEVDPKPGGEELPVPMPNA
ncbi:MAG: carboxymuconolactone decarboxylase family protein [Propionibacteriaceae bacterium]|nr:carboxymuconolactone decarboxylase family protein [Propionibacteriaceae bacterium]